MRIFIILLSLTFFSTNTFARDMATWGVTGTKCQNAIDFTKRFGSSGTVAFSSAIQGFLTGYNTRVMMDNIRGKVLLEQGLLIV